jgi:hypothetical protein
MEGSGGNVVISRGMDCGEKAVITQSLGGLIPLEDHSIATEQGLNDSLII